MRVLEIRPARVQAKHVEIGDMLVSSPIGDGAPKEPHWIGRVVDFIEPDLDWVKWPVSGGAENRQWRIERPDSTFIESAPVPLTAFVWVHLPSAPDPMVSYPADLMDAPAGPLSGGLGS